LKLTAKLALSFALLSVIPIVNDHLRSRWLEFSTIGRKGRRTSVLLSLNLLPDRIPTFKMMFAPQ
jgi:hypothetical protein